MFESGQREWRFYLDDMIAFAEKVLVYCNGLAQIKLITGAGHARDSL
jgi:uncharacterized protein with HEPN domain